MIVLCFALVFVGTMIYRDFKEFGRPALGTVLSFVCFFGGGALLLLCYKRSGPQNGQRGSC